MLFTNECDICGRKDSDIVANVFISDVREELGLSMDVCSECSHLLKAFIESRKEGTLPEGILDYLISVYGEDELIFMFKQRGDKNGKT